MWKSTTALKNDLGHHLRERYVADMGEGSVLTQRVADILAEDLTGFELIALMRRALAKHPMGEGLVDALEGIMEQNKKRSKKKSLNLEPKKVLSNGGRSRICGTAVKLLFKELLKSFKDEQR